MRFSLGNPKRVALLAHPVRVVFGALAVMSWLLAASPSVHGQDVPVEPPPVEEPAVEAPFADGPSSAETAPTDAPAAPPPPVVNPRYGVVYTRALPPEQIQRFQHDFGAAAWLD